MNALGAIQNVTLTVIEVCSLDDHYWRREQQSAENFDLITISKELLSSKTKLKGMLKLPALLRRIKPDVIVNGTGYSNLLFPLAASSHYNRVLWSESTELDNPSSEYRDFAKKQSLRAYESALVAGKAHQEYLSKLGFRGEINIVGNVVNNRLFRPPEANERENRILFVGRLLDIKNVDLLLQSYSKLCEKHPAWVLSIVGDGPQKQKLMHLATKLGIDDSVEFNGALQPEEVRNEYNRAAIFVLPSKSEPWGLVVNEAMANGLPVIVSEKCGSVSELIQNDDTGYTFNPFSADDLSSKLNMLIENGHLRSTMGANSMKRIQEYSPTSYAEKVYQALKHFSKV